MSKVQLGLGTVQFGVPYGNNAQGLLMSEAEVRAIVLEALEAGVNFYDTAHTYGVAEERLGAIPELWRDHSLQVSTKIPSTSPEIWTSEKTYRAYLVETINMSKKRLGVQKLGLLQFHQSAVPFLTSKAVLSAIKSVLEAGYCEQVGFSVYEVEEAEAALDWPHTATLQIPLNILDRRFSSPELVERYRKQNIKIIGRSAFMQGVLIPTAEIPNVIRKAWLVELRNLYEKALGNQDAVRYCLTYLVQNCGRFLDVALVGVDSLQSFKQNHREFCHAQQMTPVNESLLGEARAFAEEKGLLNPLNWYR
jgi:aryl-alcohol dehydrogenase-like predicted oxidoreductase